MFATVSSKSSDLHSDVTRTVTLTSVQLTNETEENIESIVSCKTPISSHIENKLILRPASTDQFAYTNDC